MYTRFKSQKSGMKLGLNTAAAAAARSTRVLAPIVAQQVVSSSSTVNSSPSSTPISSSNSTTTIDSITSSPFLFNHSDQPIVLVDFVAPDPVQVEPAMNESITNKSLESDRIPLNENANVINNKKSSNKKDKKSPNLNNKNSSKFFDQSTSAEDQLADVNCIRYVKSTWEKYASEIGTQNGPLRHVDENSQYPHLNGFVAFDMEHWWAERAISCMMNDHPKPTPSQSPSLNDRIDSNNNDTHTSDKPFASESVNLPLSSSALFQTNNNKLASISLKSSSISSSSSSALKSKNHHLTSSFGPASFQSLNNFQLCFS